MVAQLRSSAGSVEIQGSRHRLNAVHRIPRGTVAGIVDSRLDRLLQSSRTCGIELTGLIQHSRHSVGETAARHSVHDNGTYRNHAVIRLVAGFAPDKRRNEIEIAVIRVIIGRIRVGRLLPLRIIFLIGIIQRDLIAFPGIV